MEKNILTYNLDHISVHIKTEGNGIRLTTDIENMFIPGQTIEETNYITQKNYKIVKDYFESRTGQIITKSDLENVCFNIVLYYFQMYNHWRKMYKREFNRDLTFLQKDFESINTKYRIIDYFKKTYQNNYVDKCVLLLNMTPDYFKEYEKMKIQFENR